MQNPFPKKYLLLGLILLMHQSLFAHGFGGNGFLHPLTGFDHLVAIIAVGLLGSKIGGKAICILPTFFLLTMLQGSLFGLFGYPVYYAEISISISVLLLGIALATAKRISLVLACITIALFGFFHGYTHGIEIPTSTKKTEYIIGFLLTTAGLHIIGAVAGILILDDKKGSLYVRLIGMAITIIGVGLLLNNTTS